MTKGNISFKIFNIPEIDWIPDLLEIYYAICVLSNHEKKA